MTPNSRAREFSFREVLQQPAAVHASRLENFSCENQKRAHTAPHLVPPGGAYASPLTRDEDAMDARGAATKACGVRTAKACGPVPPTLGSSLFEMRFRPCGRNAEIERATEARKPGLRGERAISRKPLRREGRSCRLPCTVLWAFSFQPTRPAGAASARSSLRPPALPRGARSSAFALTSIGGTSASPGRNAPRERWVASSPLSCSAKAEHPVFQRPLDRAPPSLEYWVVRS